MMDVVQRWRCKDWDEVRGVPLPRAFTSNWKRIDFFQARDDDIYIITYPKSGTTWMSEIIDVVLSDGDIERSKRDSIYNKVPMLEFDAPGLIPPGSQQLESVPSPRVIKTHLPISLIPKSIWEKNCKIVYMARNPKDIAVSYYYFDKMTNLNPDPGPWDHFLERFIQGKEAYGSWGHHVREWWDLSQQKEMLYLFYEDMIEDAKREIRKVMRFLGKELDEEVLEKICQHTSFKAMKDNPLTNYTSLPSVVMDHSISPFMRKGICGDWKNHFTVSQSERFDEHYQREMSGTNLSFRF